MTSSPTPKPMASRDRKEASKRLGFALQAAYRRLIEAEGEKAISLASVELGVMFNSNIEFIFWVLKEYGGVQQMPFPRQTTPKPAPPQPVAANDVPPMPAIFSQPCTCPPIEPGIIGGNRHMTSCPQFTPAS